MESTEVVAGGEELIFIKMERKSGGHFDLGCESVEELDMNAGKRVRIWRSWLFDSGARRIREAPLAMRRTTLATARVDVQGEGSLQEGAQHEGRVQGLQATQRCLFFRRQL